ncbi:hypothetical protein E4U41_007374 [Claviceps citrina]|nr:hypothetical protein E4U41_007374 [Claviceps citrina]
MRPEAVASCLLEKFGPEDGMRLLLTFYRKLNYMEATYLIEKHIMKNNTPKKRMEACAKLMKQQLSWHEIMMGRRRDSPPPWRHMKKYDWLLDLMKKWTKIKTNSEDNKDVQQHLERNERIWEAGWVSLSDEYVALLEQKASDNELVRLKDMPLREMEKQCVCICTCKKDDTDDFGFLKLKE